MSKSKKESPFFILKKGGGGVVEDPIEGRKRAEQGGPFVQLGRLEPPPSKGDSQSKRLLHIAFAFSQ